MDQVKFFRGCLPHILLGPLLNTLTHLIKWWTSCAFIVIFNDKFPSFFNRAYKLGPLKVRTFMYIVFSLKLMPFFNGANVTKMLWNIIDIFLGKPLTLNRSFIYLDIRIVWKILRQNARQYFTHHSKMFF